ncbi:MAG TPA: O-antigen ligase family protein [Nitrospiraceae bacterium]|nr:O-antigen ligase family protein [Nitrospiraceae bacterium]
MDKISGLLDRAIWWSLVAMVVVIPLAETPKTICFISALVFWFAKMAITRDFKIKMPRLGWFLLPWVGANFLSTFNSECGVKGVRDVLTYVPFFLLIVNVVDSERRIMQLFWAVVIGIGIGDVAGLWTTISDAVRIDPQLDRLRILSLGSAAPYLVMVLSLIAGLTFQVRWTRGQWVVLGMTVSLSIVALILTYTRSMWIVCVVIMVMFAALQKTWWPSVVAAVLVMGLGVGLATSPVIQERTRKLTDLHRDSSLVERYEIWGAALNMVRDHPMLGVGAKCFVVHSERYHVPNGQRQAHNQLMNVAAETGMVGLICFLVWVAYYAVFLFKLRQLRTGTISRAMWLAAMGSFVVVAAHGMVDASFGSELALLFMLITGCLIAAKALEDSPLEGSAPL